MNTLFETQQATPTLPPGFVRWWKLYPGRCAEKPRCLAIWQGKRPTVSGDKIKHERMADAICDAVEAQDSAGHHKYGEKTCWPNASTWLYNQRWEDEVQAKPGHTIKAAAFDRLTAEQQQELLEAVRTADPGTYHSRGVIDTERAMRKLAKERGMI